MSAPKTKIFVGHLPDGCTDDDLRNLFSKHGEVTECGVINKYGFVHMKTAEEAEEAVKNLNNYYLMGCSISVELYSSLDCQSVHCEETHIMKKENIRAIHDDDRDEKYSKSLDSSSFKESSDSDMSPSKRKIQKMKKRTESKMSILESTDESTDGDYLMETEPKLSASPSTEEINTDYSIIAPPPSPVSIVGYKSSNSTHSLISSPNLKSIIPEIASSLASQLHSDLEIRISLISKVQEPTFQPIPSKLDIFKSFEEQYLEACVSQRRELLCIITGAVRDILNAKVPISDASDTHPNNQMSFFEQLQNDYMNCCKQQQRELLWRLANGFRDILNVKGE